MNIIIHAFIINILLIYIMSSLISTSTYIIFVKRLIIFITIIFSHIRLQRKFFY